MYSQYLVCWKYLFSILELFVLVANVAEVLLDQFSGSAAREEIERRDAERGSARRCRKGLPPSLFTPYSTACSSTSHFSWLPANPLTIL